MYELYGKKADPIHVDVEKKNKGFQSMKAKSLMLNWVLHSLSKGCEAAPNSWIALIDSSTSGLLTIQLTKFGVQCC